jgi:hypothetical protein
MKILAAPTSRQPEARDSVARRCEDKEARMGLRIE